ncbi:signal recognition particle 14kD protein-domain-containing protein [Lipomyces japonicus]|uniref:signal recognition particle 14kD protein-domain-containing protein n=1 Tax=Lipomyces japonicus TaxID=56871 RepID=UPI0034CEED10
MTGSSRLSSDEFLSQLKVLFAKQAKSGTVFLQQKRYTENDSVENKHNPNRTDLSDISEESQATSHSLIFRATDGNKDKKEKIKITTIVASQDLNIFFKKYSEVLKEGFGALKKKDKKKTKSKKKKGAAKK